MSMNINSDDPQNMSKCFCTCNNLFQAAISLTDYCPFVLKQSTV